MTNSSNCAATDPAPVDPLRRSEQAINNLSLGIIIFDGQARGRVLQQALHRDVPVLRPSR